VTSFWGDRFNEFVHRVTDLEGVDARRFKEDCRRCKGIGHGGTFNDFHDVKVVVWSRQLQLGAQGRSRAAGATAKPAIA